MFLFPIRDIKCALTIWQLDWGHWNVLGSNAGYKVCSDCLAAGRRMRSWRRSRRATLDCPSFRACSRATPLGPSASAVLVTSFALLHQGMKRIERTLTISGKSFEILFVAFFGDAMLPEKERSQKLFVGLRVIVSQAR